MKNQKDFIEAVMSGKTLRCGTTKIYHNGHKIVMNGEGFATVGDSFENSNDENFIHLKCSLGVSVAAIYVRDWVIA